MQGNHRNKFVVFALFVALGITMCVPMVKATAYITPSSGTQMVGIPVPFTVTGLNASRTYSVEVDDSSTSTALSPSSDGTIMFSVTFNSEGNHKVEVTDDDDSDAVVATASIYAQDITLLIVTLLSSILGIVIVLGIFSKIQDII